MSTFEITKRRAEGSPQVNTRFVVAYYLLSIGTGLVFFFLRGSHAFVADLTAGVFYLAATAVFSRLLTRRRNRGAPRDS